MTASGHDHTPASVAGCLEACRRCESVVDAVVRHDGGRAGAGWRAVGPHLRHCVEHFRLLLGGLDSGRVDYDARERDPRLENDPEAMRRALKEISAALSGLEIDRLPLTLVVTQSAAPGHRPLTTPSCLERELVFLSSHSIHHIAIMALAAETAGASVPPDLAVAYSTEAHRDALAAK
jgi:uncharacterized damage-inducible protein DinB